MVEWEHEDAESCQTIPHVYGEARRQNEGEASHRRASSSDREAGGANAVEQD